MIRHLLDRLQGKAPRGSKRSPQWPNVRAAHLERQPRCAACGGSRKLQVHHIVPFHVDPARELDPTNLVTLCEGRRTFKCHLIVGHLLNYTRANANVLRDAAYLAEQVFGKLIPVAK